MAEKDDRISALHESIIQHILSLLPSTKEAIQTSVLSKSFRNQWTHVPLLKLHSSHHGKSPEKFFRFFDKTLVHYNWSKIKKLHILVDDYDTINYPLFLFKFSSTIRKDVDELILDWLFDEYEDKLELPEFLFDNDSLLRLRTYSWDFVSMPNGRVSWGSLRALSIEYCRLPRKAIENILKGSPSLESLELTYNNPYHYNLAEEDSIVSESLKTLVLKDTRMHLLQISCPNLKELKLFGIVFFNAMPKLMYWPSLTCATLDFEYSVGLLSIIAQLHHVEELKFGIRVIRDLSKIKLGAKESCVLLNNKSLTLDIKASFKLEYAGIFSYALHCSPVLEKLVIKLPVYNEWMTDSDFSVSTKNYWKSNKTTVFNCLVTHLKNFEINSLCEVKSKFVLMFLEFLLKNARVLEKLVVIVKEGGKDFATKVSKKLLNFRKCSQHAMVELICLN